MPEKWNRKTRRQMSRLGIGQKLVEEQLENAQKDAREYATRNAFAGMMLALHKDFGFDREQLHRLAICSLNNINKSLCPQDMINELKRLSGFDINEPISDDELDPWEADVLGDLEAIDDET